MTYLRFGLGLGREFVCRYRTVTDKKLIDSC